MNARGFRTSQGREAASAAALWLLLLAVLVVAGFMAWRLSRPRPAPRSVLLIVADTLRADHLGCYGFKGPTSPNIDGLASAGTLFSDFSTVVPATLPSFASLLTSKHPKNHGASRNGFPLGAEHLRLGEVFQDGGFETAAFAASYCVSAEFGMAQGFDHFDEEFDQDTGLPHNKLIRNAESVTGAFIDWLKGRDGSRPFFAMVHYFDPHWPYVQPEPFRGRFSPRGIDITTGSIQAVLDARDHLKKAAGVPDARCRDLYGLYCGEIAFMDQQIGRVLAALEETGAAAGTLVVFTADHGETFWEHPDYFDHGLFVYDTNVRIPLVFRWPAGVEAGRRVDAAFSNIDLAPTLLELAGLEVPAEFDGRSFAGLVLGAGAVEAEPIFSEACKPYEIEEGAPRANYLKAKSVRAGPWKFVSVPFMDDRRELFNLESDPGETTNLIRNPAHREIVSALEAALQRWTDDFEGGRGTAPLDPETAEKLRGLGY